VKRTTGIDDGERLALLLIGNGRIGNIYGGMGCKREGELISFNILLAIIEV
jgi:hypothetical protein